MILKWRHPRLLIQQCTFTSINESKVILWFYRRLQDQILATWGQSYLCRIIIEIVPPHIMSVWRNLHYVVSSDIITWQLGSLPPPKVWIQRGYCENIGILVSCAYIWSHAPGAWVFNTWVYYVSELCVMHVPCSLTLCDYSGCIIFFLSSIAIAVIWYISLAYSECDLSFFWIAIFLLFLIVMAVLVSYVCC